VAKIYEAITPEDSDQAMIEKVFLGKIRSLEDTLKILKYPEMSRAARVIARAGRVVFFGVGSSGNIAKDAALRFSMLDIQAEAYDDFQMPLQAMRMKKNDVAVGISHSGQSAMPVESLNQAKKNGAMTIGISNYLQSPLQRVSDLYFCTSFPESRVRVASLSSMIAQSCLIDAMYLLAARYKKDLWDVEKMDAITDRLTRLSER
jgi:DNA-binding MurR/RpiR family transcriptional regulator